MMASVGIPQELQNYTNGESTVEVEGKSVRELINNLDARFPGIKASLVEDGLLKKGVAVAVGGLVVHRGIFHPLKPDDTVHFIPAIGAG